MYGTGRVKGSINVISVYFIIVHYYIKVRSVSVAAFAVFHTFFTYFQIVQRFTLVWIQSCLPDRSDTSAPRLNEYFIILLPAFV